MSKDITNVVRAYSSQAARDIMCSDEILSGRAAVSRDLQNMVAKYHETAAAADKERRSPYCDKAHVMRCEQIMANLEQILARNGIKVR